MSGHGLSRAAPPPSGVWEALRASRRLDTSATFLVRPDLAEVVAARRAVAGVVCDWRVPLLPEKFGELELLAAEVITNAVRYSQAVCEVVVRWDGARVRVEVADRCRELPVRGGVSPEAEGGRGLVLVGALSSAWGVTVGPGGKVVWFEVAVPDARRRTRRVLAAGVELLAGAGRRMGRALMSFVPAPVEGAMR